MHDIEPYFGWRQKYIASDDKDSPFHGRLYNEFQFSQKVYNYFIHPQWDEFGSDTLYCKILFADYDESYAIIELIGEWNDCISNDIMLLKRNVIDPMIAAGISKYVLIMENVLNFHGDDDSYYEEWYEDISDDGGWITTINSFDHVTNEMERTNLQYYLHTGDGFNSVAWRGKEPHHLIQQVEQVMRSNTKQLRY